MITSCSDAMFALARPPLTCSARASHTFLGFMVLNCTSSLSCNIVDSVHLDSFGLQSMYINYSARILACGRLYLELLQRRLIPLSQVNQNLGLAGQIRNVCAHAGRCPSALRPAPDCGH